VENCGRGDNVDLNESSRNSSSVDDDDDDDDDGSGDFDDE